MKYLKTPTFSGIARFAAALAFLAQAVLPAPYALAQPLFLPAPQTVLHATSAYSPAMVKGIAVYADNPLAFDFIVMPGDGRLSAGAFEEESQKLVKYFLAALTVPEEQMWVNLSPYEKDRVIPPQFGLTEMGRDLLAQDYVLKQMSASLMHPEEDVGKDFWERVYAKAEEKFGSADIPLNTFNKIWIIPEKAVVYENGLNAFVVESRLKVMLEEDYVALQNHVREDISGMEGLMQADRESVSGVSSAVVREVLIPEIEREVNEGENFANLRQIFQSMILASWYKQRLKESLLGKIYVDKAKTRGVEIEDKDANRQIYEQYLRAFTEGLYNFVKEDYDPLTQQIIPRKYFSGGVDQAMLTEKVLDVRRSFADLSAAQRQGLTGDPDRAMLVKVNLRELAGGRQAPSSIMNELAGLRELPAAPEGSQAPDRALLAGALDRLNAERVQGAEAERYKQWESAVNRQGAGRFRAYLEGVRDFEGYLSRRLLDIAIMQPLGEGAYSYVLSDRNEPGVIYKVAKRRGSEIPNANLLIEALAYIDIDYMGRLGYTSRLLEVGQTIDGEFWMKFKTVPAAEDFSTGAWKALPVPEKLRNLAIAAEIISELHNFGYLHNDIKPANFLRSPSQGAVILSDFGNMTRDNVYVSEMFGTKRYMAPERQRTKASDIYSFGKVLEELLGEMLGEEAYRDSGAEALVKSMTAFDPLERRPQAMTEVAAQVRGISAYMQRYLEAGAAVDSAMLADAFGVEAPLATSLERLGVAAEKISERVKVTPEGAEILFRVPAGEVAANVPRVVWIMQELLSNALRAQPQGQVEIRFGENSMEIINNGEIRWDELFARAKTMAAEGRLIEQFGSYSNKDAMAEEFLAMEHTVLSPEDVDRIFKDNPGEILFISHFGLEDGRGAGFNGMGLSSSREYARLLEGDISVRTEGGKVIAAFTLNDSRKMAIALADSAMLGEVVRDQSEVERLIAEFTDLRQKSYAPEEYAALDKLDWARIYRNLLNDKERALDPALYVIRDEAGAPLGMALYSKRLATFDIQLMEDLALGVFTRDAFAYYISAVETMPGAQRSGVGRRLVAHVARESLNDKGLKYDLGGLVYSEPADQDARAFHRRLGFVNVIDPLAQQTGEDFDDQFETNLTGKYMYASYQVSQQLAAGALEDKAMLASETLTDPQSIGSALEEYLARLRERPNAGSRFVAPDWSRNAVEFYREGGLLREPRLQVMRDSAGQIAGLALYGKRPTDDLVLLEALRVNPLENDALVYRIGIIEVFPGQAGREEVLRQLMASVARASLEDTALKYNLNGLVYAQNPAESNGRDVFFSAGFQPVVDDLVDMEMVSRSKTGYEGLPEVYLSKDQAEKLTREAAVAEQGETVPPAAAEARKSGEEAVGGIDLNPVQMDFQIRRDGEGVPLALPQQPLENINIDGFLPVIINISPATNLPLLLGIAEPLGAPYAALSL